MNLLFTALSVACVAALLALPLAAGALLSGIFTGTRRTR